MNSQEIYSNSVIFATMCIIQELINYIDYFATVFRNVLVVLHK